MTAANRNLSRFSCYLWLTLAMFVIVVITFSFYVYAEKQIDRAYELRLQSYLLADELRQSSDDLSRMVRTYVITSDPLYKQHYQEILDIRNGKKPRPVDYQNIYWDLVLADDQRPRPNGQATPLLERMRLAGFTDTEFAKLMQAKTNSDALTRLEFAAMALIESTNQPTEALRIKASKILRDTEYHQAKYNIMLPISEFYQMMEQRTLTAVHTAAHLATLVRMVFMLFGLLLIVTLWQTYRALHKTLGCSVDELYTYFARLGSGDFSVAIPVPKTMENSVLGWLSQTQINLAQIETEREQVKAELMRFKDHLEEEVQLRTTDLVLARNAAEAANRAKSVFLSNMSHELRTPLNAILGFSNLMRKNPLLSQEQCESLDIINRSGEHLLSLINAVLEMAKIEASCLQLSSAPFDLGTLVRDVIDMIHGRAQEKGLQLLIEQSSQFPRYIKGDETRLRQVLINLIGNAVKFTRQGSIIVRFGQVLTANQQHLLIEVEDTGIGINPEDQQKIFEPFEQVGQMNLQNGTGLGLTLTRQYIKLMGGSISLESTLGAGSVFRLLLPLNNVSTDDIDKLERTEKRDIVRLAPNQPEYRLLIVEDQLENQLLLTQLMKNVGFNVKVAENGEQAVELFQSWRPQLIWMDRHMPVMNGLEATRRIRELPDGKTVKIIAVTASSLVEERNEMLQAGMDDFVSKPYRFHEIYDCLAQQLAVQYIYADEQVTETNSDEVLTAKMLAVLPAELCNELYDALLSLESERINALIQQAAFYDLKLHKALSHLAENYDYPAILKALQTNLSVIVT